MLVTLAREVAVLSINDETCLGIANHDVEWVVDTTTSYNAISHSEFSLCTKLNTLVGKDGECEFIKDRESW